MHEMSYADTSDHSNDAYGYVLVHFKEDPQGYAERIYMDLSDGDNPRRWTPLNAGKPMLTSTLGTTGVRDPHIIRNPHTGVWYIIATDLRVFGGRTGSEQGYGWYDWSHHGSTTLIVWESRDLVHFSEPWQLDVAQRGDGRRLELGMAWACECLWVEDYYAPDHPGGSGAFVMYWSSKVFADDDVEHQSEQVHDTVLWGVTTDFTQHTYEYGGVFIDTGGNSIDTTMLQRPLPDGRLRTYRITKDNSFGNGIWMDSTDAKRWWEPNADWKLIQRHIGDEYEDGHGVEGPAVFAGPPPAGNQAQEWYLFVDVIPSVGYRPLITTDLDRGWESLDDTDFFLAPHTKHGGVATLTRAEYELLKKDC